MSRQEKKTRIRMLPPRIQLQQRDALTGSYPTNVRFSTDGRTGNYKISYDDSKTINFITVNSASYNTSDLFDYVMHYQNWNSDELIYETPTLYYFKQSMVGTPFDSINNTEVKEINQDGTLASNNWLKSKKSIVTYPGTSQIHPSIKSLYIDSAAGSDYGSIVNNKLPYTKVSPNQTFSISCWVNVDSISSNFQPLFTLADQDNLSSSDSAAWIVYLINGKIRFSIIQDGTEYDPSSSDFLSIESDSSIFSINNWYHMCVTYDGSATAAGLKMYVNGTEIATSNTSNGSYVKMPGANYSLIYGYYKGSTIGTKYFAGYLSEFLYVGKTLTAAEIQRNISYNQAGFETLINRIYGYVPGIGLPNTSPWLLTPDASDIQSIKFNGFVPNTGSIRSSIVDDLPFIHFTPGQEITPFRDNNQPAVDGKSSNNPFFATGSAVSNIGEGFNSPLWSKNKIEIDISVAAPCSGTMFLSGVFFTGSVAGGNSYGNPIAPTNTQGLSHEMLYYNFEKKTWQGVGMGYPVGFLNRALLGDAIGGVGGAKNPRIPYDNKIMMGFAPGIVNLFADLNSFKNQVTGVFEWQASAGQPTTSFGFPYNAKFHATSSQTLNMSQYINEPFLIEKIVVEMSAAYTIFSEPFSTGSYRAVGSGGAVAITSITQSTIPAAINNFFILNQRNPFKFQYQEPALNDAASNGMAANLTASIPTTLQLTKDGPDVYVNTVRDIITYGGVSSFAANMSTSSFRAGIGGTGAGQVYYAQAGSTVAPLTRNPKELMTRECVFSSSIEAHDNLSPVSWNGNVYMELDAKSPIRIDANVSSTGITDNVFSLFSTGINFNGLQSFWNLKYGGGGRNALGMSVPNGRNYVNPVATAQINGSFQNAYSSGRENIFVLSEDRYRYNPYILMPTDNLIFGWQQPFPNILYVSASYSTVTNIFTNAYSGSFSEIKFLPGPAKVTLYGSYIREGREYNDGTNQLLSSDSVHEVIE